MTGEAIVITGGKRLEGTVPAGGAKNSALKLLAAALLVPGRTVITNVPDVADVATMLDVLAYMGVAYDRSGDRVTLDVPADIKPSAGYELTSRMRASIVVLGPLLSRCRRGRVAMPGGCNLGQRKLDMHLHGLAEMGVAFHTDHGDLVADAPRLRGTRVCLEFPSVGATENILLAAVGAEGVTEIENAAREPEIADLCAFLTAMGVEIDGVGTPLLRVRGGCELRPVEHRVVPDRIVTGTYLIAAAMTAGDVTVTDTEPTNLDLVLAKLNQAGVQVETGPGQVRVRPGRDRLSAVDVVTLPFPGFATDLQPQIVAMLCLAEGTSIVTENVFDGRFQYVDELNRMGADIQVEGRHAVVRGVAGLQGAPVAAPDLRAGAALVCAALAADGETRVGGVHHVDRGYENLVGKLQRLGAEIERVGPTAR
jgi:UDP-N-acetylglucosamine 1-carboxyvinyltransferase